MKQGRDLWLIINSGAGSNTCAAIATLEEHCGSRGFHIAGKTAFPGDDLPPPADLDKAGIPTLAIFTGDGTMNAAIDHVSGWSGSVLVLPGGTMNLLSQRMHGEADVETIVERVSRGACRRVRPKIARCEAGNGFAGILAGPGTVWNNVREAMREKDLIGLAERTREALAETTGGAPVRCAEPQLGKAEGYPLLELTPSERGLQIDAFYAEDAGEFLQQSWAVLRHDFRTGPHDRLGLPDTVRLESPENEISLLLDGEPATISNGTTIALATCDVDLLATDHGY